MREHHPQPPTIAILGADTVVGRALCLLLEGSGYDTRLLDAYPTGIVDELLEGANLLLLVPRLDEGVREAFLGAMGKSTPQRGRIPVISLTTTATKESTRGGSPERAVALFDRRSRGPHRNRPRAAASTELNGRTQFVIRKIASDRRCGAPAAVDSRLRGNDG